MTQTTAPGPTLRHWQKRSGSRWGRWLFASALGHRSPYAATLTPRFLELRPALCRVTCPRKSRVLDEFGSIHSLAIANLCALAADMVTRVSIPPDFRWLARGMTIEYLRRAETSVTAAARLDRSEWSDSQNIGVPVSVTDANGTEVVRAVITMQVLR